MLAGIFLCGSPADFRPAPSVAHKWRLTATASGSLNGFRSNGDLAPSRSATAASPRR